MSRCLIIHCRQGFFTFGPRSRRSSQRLLIIDRTMILSKFLQLQTLCVEDSYHLSICMYVSVIILMTNSVHCDTSHMNNLVYWITDMFSRMMNHYNVSLYYPLDECDISHNSDSHRHVLTRKYVHGRDEHFSNKRGHEGISKGLLSPLGSLTQHTGLNNSRETYPIMSTSQITRPSIFDILTKVHNDLTTILVVTTANLWSM